MMHLRGFKRGLAPLALAVALMAAATQPAAAHRIGNQGCTPGYWKNHAKSWQQYKPTDTVGSVFAGTPSPFGGETLLTALQGGGGNTYAGAMKILLRAGVAAFLNAANSNIGYPYRRFAAPGLLYSQITAAIASHDRDQMTGLASWLDAANNLGCPIN
jgi:hypothetical protein